MSAVGHTVREGAFQPMQSLESRFLNPFGRQSNLGLSPAANDNLLDDEEVEAAPSTRPAEPVIAN